MNILLIRVVLPSKEEKVGYSILDGDIKINHSGNIF